ncbi:hypothetical protein [Dyadobacter psychrotolerans]|uniref:Curlin associated repeat-containing protein n=1 Tax=Dyadobacter psychrotolerans TaxID=2541721 RepID=A0A4V2Z455_9BACT|nr:hypothetical protein [Dyadobacter psychrotolerans]TDE15318.1 hypothetical protein E0F88_12420 [Dyadobacter psychrotolerans]
MKKLTLTVATLLGGFHVFAQNNGSTVTQIEDFNKSVINQSGTHTSSVLQISTAASVSGENQALVTQNNIPGFQTNNSTSKVEQYGNSHLTTVLQTGQNSLEAYIGSDGTSVGANVDNETSAIQYGTANIAKQIVRGSSATESLLSLNQAGTSNNSHQIASWAVSSEGHVQQSGNRNDVWQQVDGLRNEARVEQFDNDNYAFQWIEGGASADNLSKVSQMGDFNNARVYTHGTDNSFSASQMGDRNDLVGLSGNIYSNAEQIGTDNKALLSQIGDNNKFQIGQDGDRNTIKGTTASGALQLGDFNTGIFSQDGNDLTIISGQFGNNNAETVLQTGNLSKSTVHQSGALNNGIVTQSDH